MLDEIKLLVTEVPESAHFDKRRAIFSVIKEEMPEARPMMIITFSGRRKNGSALTVLSIGKGYSSACDVRRNVVRS